MMNALAIALVLTSLLAASVWSPSPTTHNHNHHHQDVIVKDGHRVVVVEYDKEADGSTKVLISPNDVAPDHAKGNTNSNEDVIKPSEGLFSGPRELVCDAYGKCKHKMATVLGKTKDKVEGTAHEVYDKAREIEEHAKDKISEKAKGGVDKAKKMAGEVVDTVKDGKEKVKNLDVIDSAKTMGGDIERNVTGKFEKVEEAAKETVEDAKRAGEKSLGEILRNVKDVTHDVFRYMVSRDKVDAVVGLIHMLGFSTAYGMCVWVTFISSYILGRYLPRQQFGMVQSRIYPVYFKAMAYSVSAALLGHLASRNKDGMFGFTGLSLLSALFMVLTNMILFEPRATKAMYERMKIEKEEGRGVGVGVAVAGTTRDGVAEYGGETVVRPTANVVAERQDVLRLNEKLKRLNTYSSALNVSTLVALTWHMANLGTRLYATR